MTFHIHWWRTKKQGFTSLFLNPTKLQQCRCGKKRTVVDYYTGIGISDGWPDVEEKA